MSDRSPLRFCLGSKHRITLTEKDKIGLVSYTIEIRNSELMDEEIFIFSDIKAALKQGLLNRHNRNVGGKCCMRFLTHYTKFSTWSKIGGTTSKLGHGLRCDL